MTDSIPRAADPARESRGSGRFCDHRAEALPGTGAVPTDAGGAFPLAMALEGQSLKIVSLQAGRSLDRRLTELGLHVGSRVEVRQRRSAGLVIARGGSRIALGAGMAAKILVVET
jgi:ferrous iron transport protein A